MQLRALPAEYQRHTWIDLYDVAREHHESSPQSSEVLQALGPDNQVGFQNDLAVDALIGAKRDKAKELLLDALNQSDRIEAPKSAAGFLETAKVAFVGDFSDLETYALQPRG